MQDNHWRPELIEGVWEYSGMPPTEPLNENPKGGVVIPDPRERSVEERMCETYKAEMNAAAPRGVSLADVGFCISQGIWPDMTTVYVRFVLIDARPRTKPFHSFSHMAPGGVEIGTRKDRVVGTFIERKTERVLVSKMGHFVHRRPSRSISEAVIHHDEIVALRMMLKPWHDILFPLQVEYASQGSYVIVGA